MMMVVPMCVCKNTLFSHLKTFHTSVEEGEEEKKSVSCVKENKRKMYKSEDCQTHFTSLRFRFYCFLYLLLLLHEYKNTSLSP